MPAPKADARLTIMCHIPCCHVDASAKAFLLGAPWRFGPACMWLSVSQGCSTLGDGPPEAGLRDGREWSLFTRGCEKDLVPLCRELGIGFLAYRRAQPLQNSGHVKQHAHTCTVCSHIYATRCEYDLIGELCQALPAALQPAGARDADGHADAGVAGGRRHTAAHAALPRRECAEGAPFLSPNRALGPDQK